MNMRGKSEEKSADMINELHWKLFSFCSPCHPYRRRLHSRRFRLVNRNRSKKHPRSQPPPKLLVYLWLSPLRRWRRQQHLPGSLNRHLRSPLHRRRASSEKRRLWWLYRSARSRHHRANARTSRNIHSTKANTRHLIEFTGENWHASADSDGNNEINNSWTRRCRKKTKQKPRRQVFIFDADFYILGWWCTREYEANV